MTTPTPATLRVPRIVELLIGVALVYWLNGTAPEIARAVLVLILLYLALVHYGRVATLVNSTTDSLSRLVGGPAAGTTGGGGGGRKRKG